MKLAPATVTAVPAGGLAGLKDENVGAVPDAATMVTVFVETDTGLDEVLPDEVTLTTCTANCLPVAMDSGAMTVICVSIQLV
jgi:hypothetical protein